MIKQGLTSSVYFGMQHIRFQQLDQLAYLILQGTDQLAYLLTSWHP